MKREKILQFVFPVLVVIAVWVWGRAFMPKSFSRVSSPPELSGNLEISRPPVSPPRAERVKSSYADWGRNPFEADAQRSKQSILNGILWDPQAPQAIINGEIAGVGAKVGIYTVVDIKPAVVILNDGTADLELRLGQE